MGNKVEVRTPTGTYEADLVIGGTGLAMDFAGRSELQNCAGNIASWTDRYQPPENERNERLGEFP